MISIRLSLWSILLFCSWASCETSICDLNLNSQNPPSKVSNTQKTARTSKPQDLEINAPCKIQRLDGTCIPITSCKFAMTILSINDVQTLRSMFCGFEGSHPKVCCPLNKSDRPTRTTTTARSITTTTARPIPTTTARPIPTTIPTRTTRRTIEYDYKIYENEVITAPPPTTDPFALPGRDICGQINVQDKIYGGDIAAIDEFPWLARIKFFKPSTREELFACSGSLISDRYVLTAAHCLTVYKVLGVRLGEWDTETNVDCENGYCNNGPVDVKVEKIIVYPYFDRRNLTGDVALLRLEHPVKFTDFIKPVCLPTTEYIARQDYIDSTYTVVGWGKTEYGQSSVLLRKVMVDSVSYPICVSTLPLLPKTEDPRVICAGGKNGRDSCQGDSGGPLLRIVGENYKQNWYLYGVTSYGVANCGTAGKPAAYTRVSKYMDWIRQTISGG